MWQQKSVDSTMMDNDVADNEKTNRNESSNFLDSGIVDSGFISSGGNILSSSDSIDQDNEESTNLRRTSSGLNRRGEDSETTRSKTSKLGENDRSTNIGCESSGLDGAVGSESMRADSGLDLVLTESLSQLTIEQPHLNRLGSVKVQSEPVLELRPISAKIDVVKNRRNNREQNQNREEEEAAQLQQYCQEPWKLYYTQDDDGDTQLHIAIVQGFLEATFSLIRMAPHPCLLNILNDDCQGPLHLAVLTRQPRIARRLVLAGANPALRDFRGNTALHLACASGDIGCAKALTDPLSTIERNFLANGKRVPALPQDLEQRNYDGEMCLHVAASGDQVDLVQHLLRLGADLEAREALSGRTALHLALERGCHGVVNFILRECRPSLDAPTYAGLTAYQIAICLDGQLARELVRLGAKPEPIPETDSDMSDDDAEDADANYVTAITRLRQGVGVRA